jgi:hypothetical protein
MGIDRSSTPMGMGLVIEAAAVLILKATVDWRTRNIALKKSEDGAG